MKYDDKRAAALERGAVQQGNQRWWTDHTMSYDWKSESQLPRCSPEWFDEIDRRFLAAARLFGDGEQPFAALMNAGALRGR